MVGVVTGIYQVLAEEKEKKDSLGYLSPAAGSA
jgi:hypothetical protein